MIIYFSSTGNSLYVAQKLANLENCDCISISNIMNKTNDNDFYTFTLREDEIVAFVTPVYFCGLPDIVVKFLSKIRFEKMSNNYLCHISMYGAMPGNVSSLFQKELSKYGLNLSAAFTISTIDTYIPMFDIPSENDIIDILEKMDTQIEKIYDAIGNRQGNNLMHLNKISSKIMSNLMQRIYRKNKITSLFSVGVNCIGCGLCEKVCPYNAIRIDNGKPIWTKADCTLCLGCLHRCPVSAIEYGKKTSGKKRYTNPNITYRDKYL